MYSGKIGHGFLFFILYTSDFSQKELECICKTQLKVSNDFELFYSSQMAYKSKKSVMNTCRVKAQKCLDTNSNMHDATDLDSDIEVTAWKGGVNNHLLSDSDDSDSDAYRGGLSAGDAQFKVKAFSSRKYTSH